MREILLTKVLFARLEQASNGTASILIWRLFFLEEKAFLVHADEDVAGQEQGLSLCVGKVLRFYAGVLDRGEGGLPLLPGRLEVQLDGSFALVVQRLQQKLCFFVGRALGPARRQGLLVDLLFEVRFAVVRPLPRTPWRHDLVGNSL